MAINLLPTEQKIKFKKQKPITSTQNIEMVGAEKLDKNKSAIKKAGVLSFFKQVFEKPQEEAKANDLDKEKPKKMPENKVSLKQKVTYKNIFDNRKPKIVYHTPERRPDSMKKQSSGNFIFSPFGINKGNELGEKKSHLSVYNGDHDRFPKYNPISSVKVPNPEHIKLKTTKIIEVNGEEHDQESKNLSIWQRISNWFSFLFGGSKNKKEFKDPDKISNLDGFPKPKDGPIEAIETKEVVTEKKPSFEYDSVENIDKKIGQPQKPKEKDLLLSYATPMEVEEELELKKEAVLPKEEPKYEPDKLKYDNDVPKPDKIVANNFISSKNTINIDKVISEDEAKDIFKKQKKGKNWIKSFLDWLAGLFKRNKKEEIKLMSEVDKKIAEEKAKPFIREVDKKEISSKEGEHVIFNKPVDLQTNSKINFIDNTTKSSISEIPLPPAPISVAHQEPSLPPPPAANAKETVSPNNSVPLPPSPPEEKKEDEFEMSKPISIDNDENSLNWEVNLIPVEAQEKEIPVSKILILIMVVIISCGLVFGGWLWTNYYYNTISVTISEVDAKIANIESHIAKYDNVEEDAKVLQQKIQNINLLLEKHIYWAEFFNKLEFYTLSEVYYTTMSADINGTITLMATTNNYENAIKQLFIFKEADDFVTNVTISDIKKINANEEAVAGTTPTGTTTTGLNADVDTVNFNISLKIDPNLFYYIN